MSDWSQVLAGAVREAESGCVKAAFDKAFNALEVCYCHMANVPVEQQGDNMKKVIETLLRDGKIFRDERDLADHLRNARNVITHKFGLAITMEEARRCIDRIRKLCLRFAGTVADVMVGPVVCARPEETIGEFVRMMRDNGFSQFPVVDNQGGMIGTLDEKSVFDALANADGHMDLGGQVSCVMRKELLPTLTAETRIEMAKEEMRSRDVTAFIVLKDGKPDGIVTKFELIR